MYLSHALDLQAHSPVAKRHPVNVESCLVMAMTLVVMNVCTVLVWLLVNIDLTYVFCSSHSDSLGINLE